MRVPIPDRKGALAPIFTLATDLDVSIADIEIAHSIEGDEGVLILLVDAELGERLQGGLMALGYRPVAAPDRMTPGRRPDPLPIEPLAGPVDATVVVPGSKSITNRALVCAALAPGTSTLDGVLFADDTEAMLECLGRLGVGRSTSTGAPRRREVAGCGGTAAGPGRSTLDARLSGTTARFLLPRARPRRRARTVLDGRPPLRARPMGDGLGDAPGARSDRGRGAGRAGHLPVADRRRARRPAASIARAGRRVEPVRLGPPAGRAVLRPRPAIGVDGPLVSPPYVDMTVAVMRAFGAEVDADPARPNAYAVPATGYRPTDYRIEPDASAASLLLRGGRDHRGPGARRGARRRLAAGRPGLRRRARADGRRGRAGRATSPRSGAPATLRGVTVDMGDLSDTAQTLAAVAVFADGADRGHRHRVHPAQGDRSHRRGGHRAAAVRHRGRRDRRRLPHRARRAAAGRRSRPTTTTAWP